MNIVLDTNVFLQDLFMTSRNFELLFDYLEKTNSRLILPRIVYEELSGRYRSRLSSQIEAMEIARRKLEKTLLRPELPLPVVDIDKEVDRYLDSVLDKLGITESSIIEHKPHYLSELASRSVKRLKPFTERGEEFRDALLWLSVLDIAQELCGGVLAFISCDTKAFGRAEALHSELLEDIQQRELQINYYDSIKAFIEHHAAQVEFIDKLWLLQTIAFEQFDEEINNRLAERLEKVESISWYSSHRSEWEGLEFDGYVNRVADIDADSIYQFYVYEKSDGSLYISAMYYVEYEMEFTREERVRIDSLFSRPSFHDPDIDFEDEYEIKRRSVVKYSEVEIEFGITLSDQEVIEVELADVYI